MKLTLTAEVFTKNTVDEVREDLEVIIAEKISTALEDLPWVVDFTVKGAEYGKD